jgi:dGTPase
MLQRLRFDPSQSRGRRRPEEQHPYRNPFQRDRDRIIHSRAFRRMQEKTQVFTAPLSDHFRNRLTHTIEVAQVTRTAARALGLNEDLAEALALGHDLGHPPFGHAGEAALDRAMRRYGDRFDHNIHSLRIVERFERRYAAAPGLNLTFEVREGLLKHSRDFSDAEHPEMAEYLLSLRPLLEAQLIDPADEIAYNCGDLDDAVEAKALEIDVVCSEIELFGRHFEQAQASYPKAHRWDWFNEALRRLLDFFVASLIEGTKASAEEAGVRNPDDVREHSERLARLTPEAAHAAKSLKQLLSREVYRSPAVVERGERSVEKLNAVFAYFMEHPESLPRPYQEQADRESKHRAVCDYIAGMTDTFLLKRHQEIAQEIP